MSGRNLTILGPHVLPARSLPLELDRTTLAGLSRRHDEIAKPVPAPLAAGSLTSAETAMATRAWKVVERVVPGGGAIARGFRATVEGAERSMLARDRAGEVPQQTAPYDHQLRTMIPKRKVSWSELTRFWAVHWEWTWAPGGGEGGGLKIIAIGLAENADEEEVEIGTQATFAGFEHPDLPVRFPPQWVFTTLCVA